MLDLGGIPAASTGTRMRPTDASKNSRVRAIAFDFDLLIRSVEPTGEAAKEETQKSKVESRDDKGSSIAPDVGMVSQMASLLKVKLGGTAHQRDDMDDLSLLTGEKTSSTTGKIEEPTSSSSNTNIDVFSSVGGSDIRSKYASKLRNKLDGSGGVAGIDRARQEAEAMLKGGDATGHLAARAAAVSQGGSDRRWMAMTGTGTLLQYVSNRSIKLALLPIPTNIKASQEGARMVDLTKQLPNVVFDVLHKEGSEVPDIVKEVSRDLQIDRVATMVVSDREDYLREAKQAGMITCRVRPNPNAPRGNVSAHYNISKIAEVQDIVNEIDGISFNAVLSGSRN